jgi:hypothetical protein
MIVTTRLPLDDFDSRLEVLSPGGAACALTVTLRLWLQREDTTEVERKGQTYRCRPWTAGEWAHYVTRFKTVVERAWNNQFWLRPPAGFADLDFPVGRPTWRPNIDCRLELDLFQGPAPRIHHTIRVVHLADNERDMPSNSGLMDNRDVRVVRVTDPEGYEHVRVTAVHEIGHVLGSDHPGVGTVFFCEIDPNDQVCYDADWPDVMGNGMTFRPRHARPWLDRIAAHTATNPGDWGLLRRPEPAASLIPGWY